MTVTDDIKAYIEANVTGIDQITISQLIPDEKASQDIVVAVNHYSGSGPVYTLGNLIPIRRPRIQILLRANDFPTGESKAFEIYDLLKLVCDSQMNGNTYISLEAIDEPVILQRDDLKRVIFVNNYIVTV